VSVDPLSSSDWQGRARREAVAICNEVSVSRSVAYDDLIGLMAIAWLQGVNLGAHDTLRLSEQAFARLRAALA